MRGDNFTTGVSANRRHTAAGPVPVADTNALTEDGASLVATGNVLDNDSPAGLSVSAVRFGASNGTVGSSLQGAYGTLVLNASGSYTYSLANAFGSRSVARCRRDGPGHLHLHGERTRRRGQHDPHLSR